MQKTNNLIKLSVLASTVALALAGCGSDDNTTTQNSGSESYSIQAIDGYLVNAEVYADLDSSGTLTSGDEKLGVTGENGLLKVASSYNQHPIIIKAIAGQTFDTDKAGTLTSNLELIAEKGSTVITPFSTYAVKTGKTLDEVADELNIDVSVINSDYVASKSDSDTRETAAKAHLAARSIATTIKSLDTINAADFSDKVAAIRNAVEKVVNNASDKSDLDSKLITVDDSNTAIENDIPTGTLQERMLGKGYYGINTNETYAENEGTSVIYFAKAANKDGTVSYTFNNGKQNEVIEGKATFSYDGFSAGDGKETIIYYGNDTLTEKITDTDSDKEFYLDVTSDGDLIAFTTVTDGSLTKFDQSDIVNKTYYVIFDDAGSSTTPDVSIVKMTFNDNGSMTIVEGNKTFTDSTWALVEGTLSVTGINDDGSAWDVTPIVGNDDLTILINKSEGPYIAHIMVQDEDLANSLYTRWSTLQ